MPCQRRYEVVIRTPQGDVVDIIVNEYTLRWTLRANKVGVLVLELPAEYCSPFTTFGIGDFGQDYRIELWRYVDGVQSLVGHTPWFITYLAITQDAQGQRRLRIEAESALGLAARRTVAYKSNDNASDLNPELADDQLRRIMRDHFSSIATSYNMTDGADPGDDPDPDPLRTAITTYLTIGADVSECTVNAEMNIAHQPVLQALGQIADVAFSKGEALFFDIWQISETVNPFLEFVTGLGQLGTDRTITSGNEDAIVIDTASSGGAISEYTLALDWRESAYRVYAGSQGRGEEQVFQTVNDDDLSDLITGAGAYTGAANPFALREAYISTNEEAVDLQKIIDQAEGELARLLPKLDVHGKFAENETFQWGVDWDFHDRLTVLADGQFVDVFVETLEGEIVDGRETITGTFATSLHRSLSGIAKLVQDTRRLDWWVKHLNARETGASTQSIGVPIAAVGNQTIQDGYSVTVPSFLIQNPNTLAIAEGGSLTVVS